MSNLFKIIVVNYAELSNVVQLGVIALFNDAR